MNPENLVRESRVGRTDVQSGDCSESRGNPGRPGFGTGGGTGLPGGCREHRMGHVPGPVPGRKTAGCAVALAWGGPATPDRWRTGYPTSRESVVPARPATDPPESRCFA